MKERRMVQGQPIATGVRITIHHDDDGDLSIELNRDQLEFFYDVLHDCFIGHAPRKAYGVTALTGWIDVEDLVDGEAVDRSSLEAVT